jgi:hypothetical protein
MRIIQLMLVTALLLGCRATAFCAENNQARVRAILVIASNEKDASDGRVGPYEPVLRKFLRFESYRLAGQGTASIGLPGKANLNLGQGHSLSLEGEKSDGAAVRLRVRWENGGQSLMNTGLVLPPGSPVVLGGSGTGKPGEVWALILIAN